jgi:hypothetical protein
MSEEKLKLPQKMFAALERLIRDTRVIDVNLQWEVTAKTLHFSLASEAHDLDFYISTNVVEEPISIDSDIREIVHQLAHPSVEDASLDSLTADIKDENVELITSAAVIDEPLTLTTGIQVKDFFRQAAIDPSRISSSFFKGKSQEVAIKNIDLACVKPVIHRLPDSKLKITIVVKENLFFFRRLTVQKKPAVLSFLSEREQLIYWKRAVTQTQKDARHLQMLGVYTGIAYDCVENIKMNYSQMTLTYHFKSRTPKNRCQLKDIALFSDTDINKIFMVVK